MIYQIPNTIRNRCRHMFRRYGHLYGNTRLSLILFINSMSDFLYF